MARILAAAILVLFTMSNLQAQTPPAEPNFVGGELLGRGFIYSLNYERYFTDRVGAGIGGAFWRISGSGWGGYNVTDITIVPLYLSYRPIGQTHSVYLAAGMTLGFTSSNGRPALGGIATTTMGYEFRSRGNFVIRPTANLMMADGERLWWPGISIGKRF